MSTTVLDRPDQQTITATRRLHGLLLEGMSYQLPSHVGKLDWLDDAQTLAMLHRRTQFLIGDLVNAGADRWGRDEAIEMVHEATKLDEKTLSNYAWVSRRWPAAERQWDVDFHAYYHTARLKAVVPSVAVAMMNEITAQGMKREEVISTVHLAKEQLQAQGVDLKNPNDDLAPPVIHYGYHKRKEGFCPTCECIDLDLSNGDSVPSTV